MKATLFGGMLRAKGGVQELKRFWKDVLRMLTDDILPPWRPCWLLSYLAVLAACTCTFAASESWVGSCAGPLFVRCFDYVTGSDESTPDGHRACRLDDPERLPAVELAARGGLAVCEPHFGGNSAGAAHGQFAGKCFEACYGRHASSCSWITRCSTIDSCRDAHVGVLLESVSQSSGFGGPGSADGHSYSCCPRAGTGHSDKGWKPSQERGNHRPIGRDRSRAPHQDRTGQGICMPRRSPTHEANWLRSGTRL